MCSLLIKTCNMADVRSLTCTGPVNIAIVKYWGKRDEVLILPLNSSLSLTLDQQQLRTKTTVAVSSKFKENRMWLNGVEQDMKSNRLHNIMRQFDLCGKKRKLDSEDDSAEFHVHICSENNFPTAAGLASSAAGYACLVFTLSNLFGKMGDISRIARQGSGSACRSIYGGFVAWDVGTNDDGSDSIARQIAPHMHWPEMRALLLVVNGEKKHIGSSEGMQLTVKTSTLLSYRCDYVVPKSMEILTKAILDRDFKTFAKETMRESNQMHAVCLDTFPPITYMNSTSHDIVRIVHAINDFYGETKLCYTFDAGPNACLYMLESSVPMVTAVMKHFFPSKENADKFIRGISIDEVEPEQALLDVMRVSLKPAAVQYIISTKVGPGPQILKDSESLLDESGMPKNKYL